MAQEKLEELSTQVIEKRVRIATVLLWVIGAVALLSLGVALVTGRYALLLSAAGLILLNVPMYAGRKRGVAELQRRAGE